MDTVQIPVWQTWTPNDTLLGYGSFDEDGNFFFVHRYDKGHLYLVSGVLANVPEDAPVIAAYRRLNDSTYFLTSGEYGEALDYYYRR